MKEGHIGIIPQFMYVIQRSLLSGTEFRQRHYRNSIIFEAVYLAVIKFHHSPLGKSRNDCRRNICTLPERSHSHLFILIPVESTHFNKRKQGFLLFWRTMDCFKHLVQTLLVAGSAINPYTPNTLGGIAFNKFFRYYDGTLSKHRSNCGSNPLESGHFFNFGDSEPPCCMVKSLHYHRLALCEHLLRSFTVIWRNLYKSLAFDFQTSRHCRLVHIPYST